MYSRFCKRTMKIKLTDGVDWQWRRDGKGKKGCSKAEEDEKGHSC
ncbi:hypothetical protein SETIT_5G042500v2 [Setaria italica]|uniref:Uncharacterized protein n=1 Tax=Setaria italica TaxID=4555 RepID=A0A368R127_SETIT|nr:hypothetical protein SETIT_5G042500v2 [Setaria italica]